MTTGVNKKAQSGKLVVLGSLHYDVMVEAHHRPVKGETVTGDRWYPKFGGKGGNQAVAAKKHGADVRFISATGDDNFADYIDNVLDNTGVSREYVSRVSTCGTGMSVAIQDAEGDYGAVIVSGANLQIPAEVLRLDELWAEASLLLLQNEVPEALNLIAASEAKKRSIPVCINAAPMRAISAELEALIDVVVVNAVEAQDLSGKNVDSLNAASDVAKELTSRFSTAIVTAGEHGVAACKVNESPLAFSAEKIQVVSTHGAGDTFTGVFCTEYMKSDDLRSAIAIANERAAIHVASLGSAS